MLTTKRYLTSPIPAAEQVRIRTEQDLAATIEQLDEVVAAKLGIQQEIAKVISTFRSDILKKKQNQKQFLF